MARLCKKSLICLLIAFIVYFILRLLMRIIKLIKRMFLSVMFIIAFFELSAQTTHINCQAILDRKIDSIYINAIGQSRYSALRDSIVLRVKINVDSTGRMTYAKIEKTKNITISQDTLLSELKKITLPCLHSSYATYPYWKGDIIINFKNKRREGNE